MKKILIVLLFTFTIISIFAGQPPHRGHCPGRGYGPPHRYYYRPRPYYRCGYYYRNDGVRLAADIVGLVGAGLYILNPSRPVVITPPTQTVIQQPVIVEPQQPTYIKVIGSDGKVYYQRVTPEQVVSPPVRVINY